MEPSVVKQFEREFYLVHKALESLHSRTCRCDLRRLELERSMDFLRLVLREADCIDPSLHLNGLSHAPTNSSIH